MSVEFSHESGHDRTQPIPALVIDAHAESRQRSSTVLGRLGYSPVQGASEGSEGLQRAIATRPGLIVCDLALPDLGGLELVRGFARAGVSAAIVGVTGLPARLMSATTEVARARGLAFLGWLPKPLEGSALARLLARARPATAVPLPPGGDGATLAADFRAALARDAVGIALQPSWCLRTRRLAGAEALARWRHPLWGDVSPARFVLLAEQGGFVHELTDRMLERALRWLGCSGKARGFPSVSVNLSLQDLRHPDLPRRIAAHLRAHGVSPAQLVLEVTESRLACEPASALELLTELHWMGCRLAIDDFGTGWSSLDRLRRVPAHELKLDARFITAALHEPAARAIVESSAALALRLGLEVVAEGLETPAHWRLARRLGVHRGQGYLLGRPQPPDAVGAS